jgi:hypothetical protein
VSLVRFASSFGEAFAHSCSDVFSSVIELHELPMTRSLFLRRPLAVGSRLASRHRAALIVLVRAVAAVVLVAGIATVASVMFALSWQTDSAIAGIVAAGWVAFGDLRNPGL